MGEEADVGLYDRPLAPGDDDGRVLEWEVGLPSGDDLTPLSQPLITPELASAFSIMPEPSRSMLDVHRASKNTVSSLRGQSPSSLPLTALQTFGSGGPLDDPMVVEPDEAIAAENDADAELSRKTPRSDTVSMADADSALFQTEDSNDDHGARALKKPRLVWTPQLHKRFVDVVTHLGLKNAVPKTIMHLMNVEGLTRENVASHLQKYRLYLKRIHGLTDEGPSSSDHLFASTPVPQSLREPSAQMAMPYASPTMLIPMPVLGMTHHGNGAPVGMVAFNWQPGGGMYHGFESHHPYGVSVEGQMDWPNRNKFGSTASYPHVTSHDKPKGK